MSELGWQETVLYLAVFVAWYGGTTVFYHLSIHWLIYPWTLLCFAFFPFVAFVGPSLHIPVAVLETVIGLAIDLLVPGTAGLIMSRVGGKWKKPGVILMAATLAVMAGWTSFVVYAAVAGVTIGLL